MVVKPTEHITSVFPDPRHPGFWAWSCNCREAGADEYFEWIGAAEDADGHEMWSGNFPDEDLTDPV